MYVFFLCTSSIIIIFILFIFCLIFFDHTKFSQSNLVPSFVYIGMLSSSVNLLHHVLCLLVFLTVFILFPTVALQHLSESNKRGWLTE